MRAEKKEGARALVWIDVWAWADVPAAGQPVAGARLGCLGGRRRKGPSSFPPQPLQPGTRSPHHPPALLGQMWGRARVGQVPGPGVPSLTVPPKAGRLSSLGLGVQGPQNGGAGGERLFWHFGKGDESSPVLGPYF